MTATLLAHGLGGSTDLPIPFSYAVVGAAWTLTFTFALVALAWRTPRFDADSPGRPLPAWVTRCLDARATRWVAAAAGVAFTIWVAAAAVLGPQDSSNALPGVFYVLLWVGLVAVSVLFGPVWRAVSPIRAVVRTKQNSYPQRLGYWPAAAGLFAFVWLELASPDPGSLTAVKIWLLTYLAVTVAGAWVCGPRWCARADPFEVYSMVASRCAPWQRNPDGRIAIGNPFNRLLSLPVRPGTVAVLAILLGSTAFDSFSAIPGWRGFVDEHAETVWAASVLKTVGLLVFVTAVGVTFSLAAAATGGVDRRRRRELPGLMAHSLIPIVIGYVFAHYLTYLVEKGQQTVHALLWLDHAQVYYLLSSHPSLLASIKVGFVLAGHVAGVVAAHDRALRVLPKGHQMTGQLAMMLVMVGYTFLGLYLLFGG
ncbi:hypothetical protein [Mycobacterium sp. C31M]